MKRTSMPPRRTELARTGWLPRRRKPLLDRSGKARKVRRGAQPVVDAVFARDGGCVMRKLPLDVAGCCLGPLTPHHLRKAGQGGRWDRVNLVALCANHNVWVEDWPHLATDLGLVVRRGGSHGEAWCRMRAAGVAVGLETMPCAASGAPKSYRNGDRCSICDQHVEIEHDPTGWGGAVIVLHEVTL